MTPSTQPSSVIQGDGPDSAGRRPHHCRAPITHAARCSKSRRAPALHACRAQREHQPAAGRLCAGDQWHDPSSGGRCVAASSCTLLLCTPLPSRCPRLYTQLSTTRTAAGGPSKVERTWSAHAGALSAALQAQGLRNEARRQPSPRRPAAAEIPGPGAISVAGCRRLEKRMNERTNERTNDAGDAVFWLTPPCCRRTASSNQVHTTVPPMPVAPAAW